MVFSLQLIIPFLLRNRRLSRKNNVPDTEFENRYKKICLKWRYKRKPTTPRSGYGQTSAVVGKRLRRAAWSEDVKPIFIGLKFVFRAKPA